MKKSALVVDDNEINIMIISDLLEVFGLECTKAASGEEAVRLIRYIETKKSGEVNISFVLMDYIMPEMNGIEALKKIREFSNIPVYGMSGDVTDQLVNEFRAAGAADALIKPISPNALYKVICECLREGDYIVPKKLLNYEGADAENATLLRECLKGVPGLDYDKGFRTALFREDMYLRILRSAAAEMRKYAGILAEFVHDSNRMKLKLAAHSLKTVFADVGIDNLKIDSEVVETAADKLINEPADTIPNIMFYEHVNKYKTNVDQAAAAIEKTVAEYEKIVDLGIDKANYITAQEPIDARDKAEVISYTLRALKNFEYDYILEGLEILRKAVTGDERINFEQAIDAVKNFDYDTATQIVLRLSTM